MRICDLQHERGKLTDQLEAIQRINDGRKLAGRDKRSWDLLTRKVEYLNAEIEQEEKRIEADRREAAYCKPALDENGEPDLFYLPARFTREQ